MEWLIIYILDKQIEPGDVGVKNLSGLAVELSTNMTLVTLILSRNSIEDKSGVEIAKSLINHQILKTLNLSGIDSYFLSFNLCWV